MAQLCAVGASFGERDIGDREVPRAVARLSRHQYHLVASKGMAAVVLPRAVVCN